MGEGKSVSDAVEDARKKEKLEILFTGPLVGTYLFLTTAVFVMMFLVGGVLPAWLGLAVPLSASLLAAGISTYSVGMAIFPAWLLGVFSVFILITSEPSAPHSVGQFATVAGVSLGYLLVLAVAAGWSTALHAKRKEEKV